MDKVGQLARTVKHRLTALGASPPKVAIVEQILRTVQEASLITEEGRFLRGSVTCADPDRVTNDVPSVRRADYPSFTRLPKSVPFTASSFAKLARAVDRWSGSIAVWGGNPSELRKWGVVDQLVATNVRLNREGVGGFGNPGIFTVVIDNPGDFSIYHSSFFLGAMRSQKLILHEADAFNHSSLTNRFVPYLSRVASAIQKAVPEGQDAKDIFQTLGYDWLNALARICIGLRRAGTGGVLLISPKPKLNALSIANLFDYRRLGDALALYVLERTYQERLNDWLDLATAAPKDFLTLCDLSKADVEDREAEITGAVKLITSLAAVDGAVLMKPDLSVVGFGTKIGSTPELRSVRDGEDFARIGPRARKIDLTAFGTRHTSALRYCQYDPAAMAVIISQDGHVRLAMREGRTVVLWEGVKLLNHRAFNARVAAAQRRHRARVREIVATQGRTLGYSAMPKTMSDLMKKRPALHPSRKAK